MLNLSIPLAVPFNYYSKKFFLALLGVFLKYYFMHELFFRVKCSRFSSDRKRIRKYRKSMLTFSTFCAIPSGPHTRLCTRTCNVTWQENQSEDIVSRGGRRDYKEFARVICIMRALRRSDRNWE